MKISTDKLNNYLKKLHKYECPLCKKGSWLVGDTVFYLGEYDKHGLNLSGITYPIIAMSCSECGNTILINAVLTKLLED